MSAAADVLNSAANLIERDGWCRGTYRGANGEHCVSGALIEAARPWNWVGYSEACKALQSQVRRVKLTAWNDKPERTKDEVVAVLRTAAARAG